jgi:hypothetical protein
MAVGKTDRHEMAEMAEMQMPLSDNTLPMMTGDGLFGVVKVRDSVKAGDYSDPG